MWRPGYSLTRRAAQGAALAAVALFAATGCGPDPYEQFGVAGPPPPPASGLHADGAEEDALAIRLTKDAPSPDGSGRTEDGLRRRLEQESGSVVFPHWQARRSGAAQYEVTFSYTLVGEGNEIRRRGFAWKTDVVLQMVSPPREMTEKELLPRAARVYRDRRLDRRRIELNAE